MRFGWRFIVAELLLRIEGLLEDTMQTTERLEISLFPRLNHFLDPVIAGDEYRIDPSHECGRLFRAPVRLLKVIAPCGEPFMHPGLKREET